MWDTPERPLDPPEDFHCEECGRRFYPTSNFVDWEGSNAPNRITITEEYEEDEPILCRECASFD